jgi:hypothetical protein
MICTDCGSSNLLWENVKAKKRKPYGVNDAALALPIMAKNIILAWKKVEAGIRK